MSAFRIYGMIEEYRYDSIDRPLGRHRFAAIVERSAYERRRRR